MADEQTPQDSSLFPVERTPEVDERLKEFGLDLELTPEEQANQDESKAVEEAEAKAVADAKAAEEAAKQTPPLAVETPSEKKDELSDEQAQKLVEDKTGKKGEEEVYPWEQEGREPTEKEVLDYVAQKSADIQEQRRLDEQKAEQDQKAQAERQQQENIKSWQTKWDGDLKFLEDRGYIAKADTEQGKKDRSALWEQANLHGELDLRVVQLEYINKSKGKQPAGDKAPISAPSNDVTPKEEGDEDDYYYDEVHGHNPDREYANVEVGK